jgi:SAM-dependent methyltransferase
MHDTALHFGKLFFDTYARGESSLKIVEIGSQDVNGSIRQFAAKHHEYIGLDFVEGKGVDVILTDPYKLPFPDNSVDIVATTSCFEHSEFFWLLFNECQRILKPHGLLYLNVPSNGVFHRYPVDCWRFYPDSGLALSRWSKRSGYSTELVESFTGSQGKDRWNDFVAVFIKDPDYLEKYPKRMLETYPNGTNQLSYQTQEVQKFTLLPEDQRLSSLTNMFKYFLRVYLQTTKRAIKSIIRVR